MDEKNQEVLTGKKSGKNSFFKGALCGALVVLVLVCAGFGTMYVLDSNLLNTTKLKGNVVGKETETKLELLQDYVNAKYLNQGKVEETALEEGLYKGYISALADPYSEYYTAAETEEMSMSMAGEFGGIGVTMSQDRETNIITLNNVVKEGPAGKAGIEDRDVLYKADGEDITSMSIDKVAAKVRGEVGTDVKITVIKAKTGEQKEYTITRDKIKDETVRHEMLDGNIGFIYVKSFETVTYEQFKTAMEDLEKQGMEGLIVDLRNNGGGNLNTVCKMLDLILPEGLIVYMEDKDGEKQTFTSDGENQFTKPMTVLVNEYTASASEIFAGAIQDYELGSVVGMTTYGKGVVQEVFEIEDGSSVKLTIAQYFTPKGRSIQGTGIKPEVEVEYVFDEKNPENDNQKDAALEDMRKKLN